MPIQSSFDPEKFARAAVEYDRVVYGAQQRAQQAAMNLENIKTAQANRDNQRELLDIQRQKQQLDIEEAHRRGQMTDLMRDQIETQMKQQQKQEDDVMDAHDVLAKQAAHDQHIGMLSAIRSMTPGNMSPSTAAQVQAFGGGQPAAMAPQQMQTRPNIPMGGVVPTSRQVPQQDMNEFWRSQYRKGYNPQEILKGTGFYAPSMQDINKSDELRMKQQEQQLKDREKVAKEQEQDRVKQNQTDMVISSAEDTINTIDEIKKNIRYFGAAGNIPALPGEYDKVNWEANVDKLVSKQITDLMTQLKQASRTGATGFGALSEKELRVLQSASTVLRKGMREEDAIKYLDQIQSAAEKVLGKQGVRVQSEPHRAGTPPKSDMNDPAIREMYNQLRHSGRTREQAMKQLGL